MWLDALNEMKKNSGLTIEEISDKSNIPLGTLFKVFSGQTKDPKLSTIQSVVHCMGYTLDELAENSKIKKTPPYTSEAIELMRKIDKLDTWGRNTVRAVIIEELKRCTTLRPEPDDDTKERK